MFFIAKKSCVKFIVPIKGIKCQQKPLKREPKLFMKFSWRQKIHYGILPFHYLTGISTLINFLIPVISLFAAITPWKGDMVNFILISIPVLISILGIRFYVQHWVIQRNERGIHITGGILQICSWWIYIVGFIYTIIRRKIPYLPTPKEDKERTLEEAKLFADQAPKPEKILDMVVKVAAKLDVKIG